MKKTIAILLGILLLSSLLGCAAEQTQSAKEEPQTIATTAPTDAPEATQAPAAEPAGKQDVINATLTKSGYQVTDGQLGSGATGFDVYVVLGNSTDAKHYRVSTDESTLLAALQGVSLVAGENASWGYYITGVDGIAADESKSEYWSIYEFSDSSEKFNALESAVDATQVSVDSAFMFILDEG